METSANRRESRLTSDHYSLYARLKDYNHAFEACGGISACFKITSMCYYDEAVQSGLSWSETNLADLMWQQPS